MKEVVTIITPVYNGEKYIRETVDSVLAQDFFPQIKYLVFDDGSTDGTGKILKEYEVNKKLLVFTQPNAGEQKTINKALKIVDTKYFMVVNADDPLFSPNAVSMLVKMMETHPDKLCAYPDYFVIDENGVIITARKTLDYDFVYMIRHHTCIPSVGSIVRTSALGSPSFAGTEPRDTSYRWLGDFTFWLKLALAGEMVHYSDCLATWRTHSTQASGQKSKQRASEHVRIIEEFYQRPDIPESIKAVESEARCWSYLVASVVTDSLRETVVYVLKAIRAWPKLFCKFEFYHIFYTRLKYFLSGRSK